MQNDSDWYRIRAEIANLDESRAQGKNTQDMVTKNAHARMTRWVQVVGYKDKCTHKLYQHHRGH